MVNASPIVGKGQEQIGIWLDTVQMAPTPQVPGQGSWHLVRIQAWDFGQSVFTKHSGWQPSYGFPLKSGRHSQYAVLCLSRQYALVPHGEGLHGLEGVGGSTGAAIKFGHKEINKPFKVIRRLVLYKKEFAWSWKRVILQEHKTVQERG